MARKLQNLEWVKDGLTQKEQDTIDTLLYIGVRNIENLESIVSMPFLIDLDETDVLTGEALFRLSRQGLVTELLANPAFQGGIADSDTVLVTAAGTLSDPAEIAKILTPGYVNIQTVDLATQLSPELRGSVIRTGDHAQTWTAPWLQSAVGFLEMTMQQQLPVGHVVVVLHDDAVLPYANGVNYGFAISYKPEYEQEEDTYEAQVLRAGLAHEIAHYYWRGNVSWLDEGLAELMTNMFGKETGIWPIALHNTRRGCEAHHLEMLTEWDPHQGSPSYRCSYFLGQLLFDELARTVGIDTVGQKLRDLYVASLEEQAQRRTPGVGIVENNFPDHTDVIDRHWSGGLNAPENRSFLSEVRSHGLIEWTEPPAVDRSGFVKFSGKLLNGAKLSRSIPEAREGKGFPSFTIYDRDGYVGTVLHPPRSGYSWNLGDNSPHAEPFEYLIYPDSFRVGVRFPPSIDDPTEHYVVVWGFRDDRRIPYAGSEADILGIVEIKPK